MDITDRCQRYGMSMEWLNSSEHFLGRFHEHARLGKTSSSTVILRLGSLTRHLNSTLHRGLKNVLCIYSNVYDHNALLDKTRAQAATKIHVSLWGIG